LSPAVPNVPPEAWRTVLIEASQALSDAWLELRWLLYLPSRGVGAFDAEASEPLNTLGMRCAQAAERVILVFGRESRAGMAGAGMAASEVDVKVSALKHAAIWAPVPWDGEARARIASAIRVAEEAHKDFQDKAHVEIRPPGWQA
jgi:hypothetical protein